MFALLRICRNGKHCSLADGCFLPSAREGQRGLRSKKGICIPKRSIVKGAMRRFFIHPDTIAAGSPALTGADARHIKSVLRLKRGDCIEVFDGAGRTYTACIGRLAGDRVEVELENGTVTPQEESLEIVAAQALLKDRKMDTLIRQVTELGISRWVPFVSERTVPSPGKERLRSRSQRWEKIAREALKQCRRDRLPAIEPLHTFDQVLDLGADCAVRVFFWEEATATLETVPFADAQPRRLLVVFGPEGGFSKAEAERAREQGFALASLGPRILRAETATLAGCALVQYLFGDMGPKKP